jgi:hypothetical protein
LRNRPAANVGLFNPGVLWNRRIEG